MILQRIVQYYAKAKCFSKFSIKRKRDNKIAKNSRFQKRDRSLSLYLTLRALPRLCVGDCLYEVEKIGERMRSVHLRKIKFASIDTANYIMLN